MKNNFFILAFLLILASCKKEYDLSTSNRLVTSTRNINTMMTTGNWRIRQYWHINHDETVHFRSYLFNFGTNMILTATKRGSIETGSWIGGEEDSKIKLIINFTTPQEFLKISNTWEVTEMTDNTIRLQFKWPNGDADWIKMERN